jgi:hypothetical protein
VATISDLRWFCSRDDVDNLLDESMADRDIHLLPGFVSPRLDHLLWIIFDDSTIARADKSSGDDAWILAFDAGFHLPSPNPQFNHGVTVNELTGEVSIADPLPPPPRLRSFVMTVTVTQGTVQLSSRIRFHIHDSLERRWLTPSTLTVRKDATNMRFSVLARFNDGVIGDITNWGAPRQKQRPIGDRTYVHRVNSADPEHHWSQTPDPFAPMQVDPLTGEIACLSPTASVTVNLHAGQRIQPVASAVAEGAPPWSDPVRIKHWSGPGVPAMARVDVRNVLFLPDGFVADPQGKERDAFETYVRMMVNKLNTEVATRPYDLLGEHFGNKLNYFSAWVPSPEEGCSALVEHFSVDQPDPITGEVRGWDLEIPTAPTGAPTDLSLTEMFDTVGLPTPVFDPPGSPPGTDAAGRVHDWQQLYGPLPTVARVAVNYEEWLARTNRVLINERNTAFHVAAEYRPHIDRSRPNSNSMGFHPLRLTVADFDTFLKMLRDENGDALPKAVWADGAKDDAYVVMVCRTARFGGSNDTRNTKDIKATARVLCVPFGVDRTHTYKANPNGNGFDLVPDEIPKEPGIGAWTVIAHELAHSLTLNDEYSGDSSPVPDYVVKDVKVATNVQEGAALEKEHQLSADAIKWRWKRLHQAGLLADPSAGVKAVRADPAAAGQFLLSVESGHGAAFADPEVDIVRLRKRNLLAVPVTYSQRLRLIDVHGDQLTVKLVTGSHLDPAAWAAGDLVVGPVRGKDPDLQNDVLGDDLELVHKIVVDRINATHNPLNAQPSDSIGRACSTPAPGLRQYPPVAATNFAAGTRPQRPALSYKIVGLYEGGKGYDCGVYHPTGQCIMNLFMDDRDNGTTAMVKPFCPVCRYAMVDLLDPSQHGRLDDDYYWDYPK